MYSALLHIHSYLRWVVLILALIAIVRAIGGVTGRRDWVSADRSIGAWFVGSLDLQLLLGLVLYFFLSPITREAFADFGGAMRNAPLRFFAVEHTTGMIIAVALAHVGRARTKKAKEPLQRHKAALIFYALALVATLLSIPWPGTPGGRPLFRGLEQTVSVRLTTSADATVVKKPDATYVTYAVNAHTDRSRAQLHLSEARP